MLESWYLLPDARWFTVQYVLGSSTCKLILMNSRALTHVGKLVVTC